MTSALKISMNLKAELMTAYYAATLNFEGCLHRMIQEGEEHKQKRNSLPKTHFM